MAIKSDWKPYATYTIVALAILAPLLKPGFVLALDMVFTPKLRMPDGITSSYLLHAALHFLNFAIPADILEKLLLFVTFFLAGLGMYRLVQHLKDDNTDGYQALGAYAAGLFYVANPFTYDRLMTGQYNVLLGYALLPWFTLGVLKFLRVPHGRNAVKVAVWLSLISIVSIHTLGLAAVITLFAGSWFVWRRRNHKAYLCALLKWTFVALAIFVAASSYWLVPLVLGKGSTAQEISRFSTSDARAFATLGNGVAGKFGNIIRLQGFWAESRNLYTLPQAQVHAWGLLVLLLWGVMIVGGISAWRHAQRFVVLFSAACIIVATAVAIGFSNGLLANTPLLAGYREPQKFVALVAFGYALLVAWGTAAIMRWCQQQLESKVLARAAGIVALLLPAVVASTIWWGGNGQLSAAKYPEDWTTANGLLNADHDNFQTLFLPWHLYTYFDFAGRIILNPAPEFFDKPVVISDDPEFRGAAAIAPTHTKKELSQLLPHGADSHSFAQKLATLHIKYILLAKDNDYRRYDYLRRQPDLQLVQQGRTMDVYRNNDWRN